MRILMKGALAALEYVPPAQIAARLSSSMYGNNSLAQVPKQQEIAPPGSVL
jgi:hypothetical protein